MKAHAYVISKPAKAGYAEAVPKPTPIPHGLGLSSRNIFDTFVVGNNNRFAFAAALAVAQAPGRAYNPLFLYGGSGLGKTHLLRAIGHHISVHNNPARVGCLSCEQFANEYLDAIHNSQLARFRKKYREAGVLLLDDIQFLAGKAQIQEEFFHTFNALHENQRQIVLTANLPAGEIPNLERRLVSRLEWGLVADLQPPEAEVRLEILNRKAQNMGVKLPQEIMHFLGSRFRANICRLEGALTRVASYAMLTHKDLSLAAVEDLLREMLSEEDSPPISIDTIQRKVAQQFHIRPEDMTSRRRPENVAFPRQVAMFLSRKMIDASLNVIGETFGGRNHTTVLRACRVVKDRMETDPHVRRVVSDLEKKLAG